MASQLSSHTTQRTVKRPAGTGENCILVYFYRVLYSVLPCATNRKAEQFLIFATTWEKSFGCCVSMRVRCQMAIKLEDKLQSISTAQGLLVGTG